MIITSPELAWQDGTQACNDPGLDPDWFFSDDHKMQIAVTAVCSGCPLLNDCADYALHHNVEGVWGGMTERSLTANRRKLGITPKPIAGDMFFANLLGGSNAKRMP